MKPLTQASAIALVSDNKILVLKRSDKVGSYNGLWNLPAGGVEPGESWAECAIRECKEEANLDVDLASLVYIGTFSVENSENSISDIHYFLSSKYSGEIKIDWESSDYKWVDVNEITSKDFIPVPERVVDIINIYLKL